MTSAITGLGCVGGLVRGAEAAAGAATAAWQDAQAIKSILLAVSPGAGPSRGRPELR